MNDCEHLNFQAQVNVFRRMDTDKPNAIVVGFSADITIECSQCKTPFHFVGVPSGVSVNRPMVSMDGLELRAPIEPGIKGLAKSITLELDRHDLKTVEEVQ